MSISKRDFLFVAIIVAVFVVFYLISGPEKTKKVPRNATHQQFYDMRDAGKKKNEIDPLCASCHDGVKIGFPADHPAKPGAGPMRCLFCHKMFK